MRTYEVRTSSGLFNMRAESIRQDGEYISFYSNKEVVGLVRLAPGESLRQLPEDSQKLKASHHSGSQCSLTR